MDGVLNINKPSGPTSHDVVDRIRRAAHMKRVGHAGTLDPLASGVLVAALGNATRVIEYMSDWPKSYTATAVLGAETDTEDITGNVIRETECAHITREALEAVLPQFTGSILQIPPMVSALHHNGKRLYELARAGQIVERAPRPVEIYSLRLLSFEPGDKPTFALDVSCSGGTYIRTLCADIGKTLGCGAYMSSLVRTAVGRFHIEEAVTLEAIDQSAADGRLEEILYPIDEVLIEMPMLEVAEHEVTLVTNGVVLSSDRFAARDGVPQAGEPVRIHSQGGKLIAIGVVRCGENGELNIKPQKVFADSDQGGDE